CLSQCSFGFYLFGVIPPRPQRQHHQHMGCEDGGHGRDGDDGVHGGQAFPANRASILSKLCVQPASMPCSMKTTCGCVPLATVWNVIFVLLPCSSHVTV